MKEEIKQWSMSIPLPASAANGNLYDIFSEIDLSKQASDASILRRTMQQLFMTQHLFESSADAIMLVSPETHKRICQILSQRPHQRKLRKCHLRKIYRCRKRERRHR